MISRFDDEASQHEVLARLARSMPARSFLEVGVRDGCSLWVVIEAARESLKLVACADDWGVDHGGTGRGTHEHIDQLLRAIGYYAEGGEVAWLDGRSQETLPALTEEQPSLAFDLVHVDGNHDEDLALQDLENGWRLAASGGAMVSHDTKFSQVGRACQRFSADAGVTPTYLSGGHGTAVWIKG